MHRSFTIACFIASAALSLASCNTTGTHEPPPKISELRPANPLGPETRPATGRAIQAMVRRVDLPLSGSIDKAWSLVTTDGLDGVTVTLWKANGFRVGLLDMKRYPEFVAAIPDKFAVEAQVVINTGTPTPFSPGAPLTQPTRVKLTTVTREELETLRRGTPQLLAEFTIDETSTPVLTLTPHHFFPKRTIEIRSPLEAQLDGRVFHEMALHAALPPDRILVIALDRPEPPATQPAEEAEPAEADAEQANVATDSEPAEPAPAPVTAQETPPRELMLGDLILSSSRMRRPLQRVIMIGVPKAK